MAESIYQQLLSRKVPLVKPIRNSVTCSLICDEQVCVWNCDALWLNAGQQRSEPVNFLVLQHDDPTKFKELKKLYDRQRRTIRHVDD